MGSCAEAQTAAKPAALPSANSEAPVLSASGKQDGSLLIAEDRQVGILSLHAYASYFRQATSSGSLLQGAVLFVFVTLLVVLAEVCRTSTEIWVTLWTEATGDSGQDLPYWLGGYSAILILLILVCLLRAVVFTMVIVRIAAGTHTHMVQKVLRASAPLFFDVVPAGRILNRFSRDLDAMDSQLPDYMAEFLTSLVYVTASAAVCVTVSPFAIVGLVPLCIMFVYVRRYYTCSARELKRLESVSRSPLYVDFQELLTGLVHLRAFGLEQSALRNFERKVDENNQMFFHLHALVPFNVLRGNGLAALFVSIMAAVVVVLGKSLETSLIGLGLSAAAGLVGRLHQTIRFSAEVENNFTSVERLQHFDKVPQEAENTDAPMPVASWPSSGEVVFEEVKLCYRPHLPLVLDGVSFRVLAGQRAGIIGRTGSGKSTCMGALLRLVELAGGRILIDGQDLAKVPLQLLRGHAVAIIPQDPFLFAGTVRDNLDPFGMSSATEHQQALAKTGLWEALGEDGLDSPVHGRGANFSVGQRQLLCFARALLRQARVMLLDEASANIDALTDAALQKTLRTCFSGSTLLIIAHRLSTIADADLLICMDKGKVEEAGPPAALRRKGGVVATMFANAGEPELPAEGRGDLPSTKVSL
ncbi:abcC12 [Symbiodinium natans]|uniref:AbcC12 protein n=1 Tax=Symbiodinium natans TaxID=878477 RepID=A0A812T997_9DINO|nr:abcC12 [Symbiodinium natans]